MTTDETGRKLKVGSIVKVQLVGMFTAKVLAIKDTAIVVSPQQRINPHLVLQVPITPMILPNGSVPDVYIVGEPDPKDPVVIEAESRSKISLIKPS